MYTAIRTLTLALFVLSLMMTPFAVAAPGQQNKMIVMNRRMQRDLAKGRVRSGRRL